MPAKRPEYQQGSYYHIFNRGAHQRSIFKDNENYLFALRKIKQYSNQFQHTIIAYWLIPNHYHLLVRQDGDFKASLLPQQVFNSYTKAFNKRYNHSGTLFEDSFHIKIIRDTSHLLHLCRYIHGNPVKDGFVADPADWEYSNYREFIGARKGSLFDPGFFTEFFSDTKDYRDFVLDDLSSRNLPNSIRLYMDLIER
jgi:REP element-mobilizing transposase RayT